MISLAAGAWTETGIPAGLAPAPAAAAQAAAALFAVGAVGSPQALYAGEPARPISIWRERVFIASPCQAPPAGPPRTPAHPAGPADPQAGTEPGPADPEAGPADPGTELADPGTGLADPAAARTDISARPRSAAPAPGPRGGRPRAGTPRAGTPQPAGAPSGADHLAAADHDPVAGIEPWSRCFAEQLRPAGRLAGAGGDGPWRVTAATNHPFRKLAEELFPDDPHAGRALAILGDADDPEACAAALSAAEGAISTGQLVVISNGPGFTGFFASLHAEQPSLGITLLRVRPGAAGLRAARRYAAAAAGQFRELSIDAAGR